jgi:hypothetical protein
MPDGFFYFLESIELPWAVLSVVVPARRDLAKRNVFANQLERKAK